MLHGGWDAKRARSFWNEQAKLAFCRFQAMQIARNFFGTPDSPPSELAGRSLKSGGPFRRPPLAIS